MKEKLKGLVLGIVIGALLVPTVFATVSTVTKNLSYNDVKITLNGRAVKPTDANGVYVEPFIIDGTTYLPVRGIADALGLDVEWNSKINTVVLTDKAAEPEKEFTAIGETVYDANGIKITLADVSDERYYFVYEFLIENDADYKAVVEGFGTTVNGTAVSDGKMNAVVDSKEKATAIVHISKEDLADSRADFVETLDMKVKCRIMEASAGIDEIYEGKMTVIQ